MSIKTFKVGEYGYCPKYKLTTKGDEVMVQGWNWDGLNTTTRHFSFKNLEHLEFFLWDEVDAFHADKMRDWVVSTKEWKAALEPTNGSLVTCYTFNRR